MNWTTEKRLISDLKPASYNPRKYTPKQFQDLKTSIEKFDLADPIIVNENNTVIGGHFRLRVLKEKGIQEVDVRVPDILLTEREERELNLRLNKNLGEWDFTLLKDFEDDMLSNVGFELDELGDSSSKDQDESIELKSSYEILVKLKNEEEQKNLYEYLVEKGHECKLFIL